MQISLIGYIKFAYFQLRDQPCIDIQTQTSCVTFKPNLFRIDFVPIQLPTGSEMRST